ncbi:MAG: VOC family protein [Gammaproteobacteria bacterium]|jgi:predicted enzyme related to lactoylglutathione lyase|nr:VOC family protein [Gammaproteobacteria bacterium]
MTPSALRQLLPIVALTLITSSGTRADTMPIHTVTTTKFTVEDAEVSKAFYEDLLGIPELRRYVDEGRLVEPFMGWVEDGRIGLLDYSEKETLKKSSAPVSAISVPDLEELAARFESAGQQFPIYDIGGGTRLSIVNDPSGNAIEIVEVEGPPAVMGARLIVEDRAAAEEWFLEVFDVEPDNRIVTDNFDEVFLKMGGGLFFALYEPKDEPPLPKSNYPVVAIYSTDYDGVLERIKALGLYVRERGDGLLFARDPSGNVVEVVRQTAR